ncbi:MAG: UPF0262 family protein [Pseudomonadota bacterium]
MQKNNQPFYLSEVVLDENTIQKAAPAIEHERNVAIYDLIDLNFFKPNIATKGPYHLKLGINDKRTLVFDVMDETDKTLMVYLLSLTPFKRMIHDYHEICDSYFDAIKRMSPAQIETIDMARRAIHNEGSELLQTRLEGKIHLDNPTARRLFTLVFALHAQL